LTTVPALHVTKPLPAARGPLLGAGRCFSRR
jgi:hypothetical protein